MGAAEPFFPLRSWYAIGKMRQWLRSASGAGFGVETNGDLMRLIVWLGLSPKVPDPGRRARVQFRRPV